MICLAWLDGGWRRWTRSRAGWGDTSPCCGRPGHRGRASRTVWRGYEGCSRGIRDAGAGTWDGSRSRHSLRKSRNAGVCPPDRSSRRARPWSSTRSSSAASHWRRDTMRLRRQALHSHPPLQPPSLWLSCVAPRIHTRTYTVGHGDDKRENFSPAREAGAAVGHPPPGLRTAEASPSPGASAKKGDAAASGSGDTIFISPGANSDAMSSSRLRGHLHSD